MGIVAIAGKGLSNAFNPINIVRELGTVGLWGRFFIPICSVLMVVLSIQWGSTWWQILSTLSGVVCVVLVAERKITNFAWGLINCSLYGLMSYQSSFYGDATLNWLLYVPFQFLGMYAWTKNAVDDGTVKARSLDIVSILYWASGIMVGIVLVDYILTEVKGSHTFFDASNVVLSIAATILMYRCYSAQWICWILVNISGIMLWWNSIQSTSPDIAGLMMWIFFLANSIYGYIVWRKNAKTGDDDEWDPMKDFA